MFRFTVFALCIQALLIQSVMSQLGCGCGLSGIPGSSYSSVGYGGQGTGNVRAAGPIDACGTTCVDGKVPVLGSVSFGGCADACGKVSICGQCGCGCK